MGRYLGLVSIIFKNRSFIKIFFNAISLLRCWQNGSLFFSSSCQWLQKCGGTFYSGGIQWLCGHNFALFWPPPTSTWTFLTLNVDKIRDFLDHLPPLLVHIVIECPLTGGYKIMKHNVVCQINVLIELSMFVGNIVHVYWRKMNSGWNISRSIRWKLIVDGIFFQNK